MKTILVADDEDFPRLLVKETLTSYRVIGARDGDGAVLFAREAAPDLLILDWMMPGRHGPAVLEALRADPAPRPARAHGHGEDERGRPRADARSGRQARA